MQQNHSPTPWRLVDDTFVISIVDANGKLVEAIDADGESHNPLWPKQAERIVRAVNSHDDLLKLCKLASSFSFLVRTGAMNPERAVEAAGNLETKLQAAITKAEGAPCHPEN